MLTTLLSTIHGPEKDLEEVWKREHRPWPSLAFHPGRIHAKLQLDFANSCPTFNFFTYYVNVVTRKRHVAMGAVWVLRGRRPMLLNGCSAGEITDDKRCVNVSYNLGLSGI